MQFKIRTTLTIKVVFLLKGKESTQTRPKGRPGDIFTPYLALRQGITGILNSAKSALLDPKYLCFVVVDDNNHFFRQLFIISRVDYDVRQDKHQDCVKIRFHTL